VVVLVVRRGLARAGFVPRSRPMDPRDGGRGPRRDSHRCPPPPPSPHLSPAQRERGGGSARVGAAGPARDGGRRRTAASGFPRGSGRLTQSVPWAKGNPESAQLRRRSSKAKGRAQQRTAPSPPQRGPDEPVRDRAHGVGTRGDNHRPACSWRPIPAIGTGVVPPRLRRQRAARAGVRADRGGRLPGRGARRGSRAPPTLPPGSGPPGYSPGELN